MPEVDTLVPNGLLGGPSATSSDVEMIVEDVDTDKTLPDGNGAYTARDIHGGSSGAAAMGSAPAEKSEGFGSEHASSISFLL